MDKVTLELSVLGSVRVRRESVDLDLGPQERPGYVLSLNGHELDSDLFDAELDEANRLLRSADDEAAFSPDSKRVAILLLSGAVQIMDVETGRRVGVPMSFPGVVVRAEGIVWTEDGSGVWVGTPSGPHRFAADTPSWREIACGIVNRELTADEWRDFVSETETQVRACG